MSFDLSLTGLDHPPAFLTPVAAHDWLATVPMANSGQAQVMLLRQLNLLQGYTLVASERLAILESLRETVADVQDNVSKKFAGKPLPFTPPEQAALDGTLAVWQALLGGYLRLLDACAGDVALEPRRALIAQRSLTIFADWQVDLCRGEQLPDSRYWQLLNQVFSVAEGMGILGNDVNDASRHGNTLTSALAAYGECCLLHMASPFELPPRQLNWIVRWARRWGSKLSLMRTAPPQTGERAIPLYVDLGSHRPPGYQSGNDAGGRWLDTTALRKSIKSRITLLEQGEQPSRLQLGEDCTQPATGLLLQRVYQRWCKGGATRRQERKSASGGCEFIISLEAVHYYLEGRKPFRPPTRDSNILRQQRDEIATFGQVATHHDNDYSDQHGYEIENWAIIDDWQLLDQSASGLRLMRPLKAGVRVGNGQLVAVKLAGSRQFVIGSVRWALHDKAQDAAASSGNPNASLSVGIQLFPGLARTIAVRPCDPGLNEAFQQGLLLPAVAALHEPEAVIVPAGTFRVGRPVEVWIDDQSYRYTLTRVLDRGSDFERCTYATT
jgi:hypothetical protein